MKASQAASSKRRGGRAAQRSVSGGASQQQQPPAAQLSQHAASMAFAAGAPMPGAQYPAFPPYGMYGMYPQHGLYPFIPPAPPLPTSQQAQGQSSSKGRGSRAQARSKGVSSQAAAASNAPSPQPESAHSAAPGNAAQSQLGENEECDEMDIPEGEKEAAQGAWSAEADRIIVEARCQYEPVMQGCKNNPNIKVWEHIRELVRSSPHVDRECTREQVRNRFDYLYRAYTSWCREVDALGSKLTGSDGSEREALENNPPACREIFDRYDMFDKPNVRPPFLLNTEIADDMLDDMERMSPELGVAEGPDEADAAGDDDDSVDGEVGNARDYDDVETEDEEDGAEEAGKQSGAAKASQKHVRVGNDMVLVENGGQYYEGSRYGGSNFGTQARSVTNNYFGVGGGGQVGSDSSTGPHANAYASNDDVPLAVPVANPGLSKGGRSAAEVGSDRASPLRVPMPALAKPKQAASADSSTGAEAPAKPAGFNHGDVPRARKRQRGPMSNQERFTLLLDELRQTRTVLGSPPASGAQSSADSTRGSGSGAVGPHRKSRSRTGPQGVRDTAEQEEATDQSSQAVSVNGLNPVQLLDEVFARMDQREAQTRRDDPFREREERMLSAVERLADTLITRMQAPGQ